MHTKDYRLLAEQNIYYYYPKTKHINATKENLAKGTIVVIQKNFNLSYSTNIRNLYKGTYNVMCK